MPRMLHILLSLALFAVFAGCETELDTTCETADDCQLLNGCCHCMAINVDETPPGCETQECFATECSGEFGTNAAHAACDAGNCVVELDDEGG